MCDAERETLRRRAISEKGREIEKVEKRISREVAKGGQAHPNLAVSYQCNEIDLL